MASNNTSGLPVIYITLQRVVMIVRTEYLPAGGGSVLRSL